MENKNETIETITKSYEEKIAEREKQVLKEKEEMKKQFEKEKADALALQKEEHNKEIADIILGRKSAEQVQNNDEEENDKSFFDKAVENTKKKLQGGK